MKGILLNTDFDLQINAKRNSSGKIVGGLAIGDNTDQCAAIALQMGQGELKEDPLLGAGLTKYIRDKYCKSEVKQRIRQHLTRAGINYNEYKQKISITINDD